MTMPNISSKANAITMKQMQEQMKAMIAAQATAAADEIGLLIQQATKVTKADVKSAERVMPEFNDDYVQALVLAAAFRALRDEYATAYMRVEQVQQDKALCLERVANQNPEKNPIGNCRTDVEYASVMRSLEYYDTLENRLEQIDSGLRNAVLAYESIAETVRKDDDARQQDIPTPERKYTSLPQLRWIKAEDRTSDPKHCNLIDDIKSAHRQAERFIEYNWNRS